MISMDGGRFVKLSEGGPTVPKPKRKPHVVKSQVAARLKALRHAYGWRQNRIAAQVGISAPSWNKYELGNEMISIYHAALVECKTGATLDWIYLGRIETMPPRLLERLNGVNGNDSD